MQIKTEVRTDGPVPVTVISIQGELDTMTFGDLERKGEEVYKAGARRIVLDLSEVRHISSAGLRAIHTIYNLLRSNYPAESDEILRKKVAEKKFKSTLLKLVSPNESILQILQTSGYNAFLEVHKDLNTAIQSF